MADDAIRDELTALFVAEYWFGGDPAACRTAAQAALNRWRSFDRRNRVERPAEEHRIEDLAKGLQEHLLRKHRSAPREAIAGRPTMTEYRHVARSIARVLSVHTTGI
jgi:hypothetical protein